MPAAPVPAKAKEQSISTAESKELTQDWAWLEMSTFETRQLLEQLLTGYYKPSADPPY